MNEWLPISTANTDVELEEVIGCTADDVYSMMWFEGKWVNAFSDIVYPEYWMPMPESKLSGEVK